MDFLLSLPVWLLVLLAGVAALVVLVFGGWLLHWAFRDRTAGSFRHRRPRRPAPWHREPSGAYALVLPDTPAPVVPPARHRWEHVEEHTMPIERRTAWIDRSEP